MKLADVGDWPEAADPECPLFRHYRRESRRDAGTTKRAFMTLNVDFRRGFGATQRVKSAAIPTAKCSLSYSITSSARSRDASGIVRPSALAVLRLTANSNKVGCSIGRSPGFSPRRIRATYSAGRRQSAAKFGP